MTQDDFDKALRTITKALDFWVSDMATRKTQEMMLVDRKQALEAIHVLLVEHYVTHAER